MKLMKIALFALGLVVTQGCDDKNKVARSTEVTPLVMPCKPTQVSSYSSDVVILCDDGSVWRLSNLFGFNPNLTRVIDATNKQEKTP